MIMKVPDGYDVVPVRVWLDVAGLDLVEENSGDLVGLLVELLVRHLLPCLRVDESHAGLDIRIVLDDILKKLVDGDICWMVVILSAEVAAVRDPHSS